MAKTYLTAERYWAAVAKAEKNNRENPNDTIEPPSIDSVRDKYWMMTIGEERHSREEVIATLTDDCTCAVFSFETGGKTGYRHFQLFAYWAGKATGKHVRSLFGDAHAEPKRDSVEQCVAYCTKSETHTGGPWWIGNTNALAAMRPTEKQQQQRTRFDDLADAVDSGMNYFDLLNDSQWRSWTARNGRAVRDVIAARMAERFGNATREVSCDYIFGPGGSGKTSAVFDTFAFRDVFIANPSSSFPFDGYQGEPVLLLDDFRSSLPYSELLRVLDRYPLPLNIKGGRTFAGWKKVVITSNVPLQAQYPNVFDEVGNPSPEKRDPLFRRFSNGIVFEIPRPGTKLPYNSEEDAMRGVRNDGRPNGVPGWKPAWERSPEERAQAEADAAIDSVFASL